MAKWGAERGEAHHFVKLTLAKVRRIRTLYRAGGWTHVRLAELFEVSHKQIERVLTGENWGWDLVTP